MIVIRNYTEPPICEKEILRYAGCKSSDEEFLQLLYDCIQNVREKLTYKVCYMELPLTITEDICDFGYMKVKSKDLIKNLEGCKKVVLFAATIGVEIDRLIAKYSRISPAKALLFQAIGAERIEALCDAFCKELQVELCDNEKWEKKGCLCPRFSPGYGDLPLEIQKTIFQILDCSKQIGLSLNDSLLMSPSKSVTAFVGILECKDSDGVINKTEKECTACKKIDCAFRER